MGAPIVHFEIGCRDSQRTGKFYTELFGWGLQSFGPATMIDTQGGEGINGHITALGHEPHHYVTIYAQVDDLDATLARAKELGGETVVPPTEAPEMGHFAWLKDPDGNVIGLWKSMTP